MILWHRWCTPLLLAVIAVWFATGWVGCAAQTGGTRVELSSGQLRVARDRVPLDFDDTGLYWLGRVLSKTEQERRFLDLVRVGPATVERPYELSSRRERYERREWSLGGREVYVVRRIGMPTRKDWNYAIWPAGAVLLLWKSWIVSYRLWARRGHLCQWCGYDRRGLGRGSRCPECGKSPAAGVLQKAQGS